MPIPALSIFALLEHALASVWGSVLTALFASSGSSGFVGNSRATAALLDYLPKVACSDATVLITGETGTGKERVASTLHNSSKRSQKPFIAVNCAAIPDALIESELFGHERGAFTGASSAFPGKFGMADGGTLFLDEIGEMSLINQAKLLRAIEGQAITPVGSMRARQVDVRIIAATNIELEEKVEKREFRADLFYRLNVARLELPPLRDRPDDIEPIMQHFIAEQNRNRSTHVGCPDGELLGCMLQYHWPGNVRELRNMVEALFIDPPAGCRITLADIPPNFQRLLQGFTSIVSNERDKLVSALRQTNWNKVEAARQLNWSRMTLYRKLAKYELDSDPNGTE